MYTRSNIKGLHVQVPFPYTKAKSLYLAYLKNERIHSLKIPTESSNPLLHCVRNEK